MRHALRVLTSQWAVTSLSVLCLGLAIGTNTTVFTFVNGLLLRPLPLASANFFSLLGVEPARGRGFQDGDGDVGAAPTVLISHALWQQRYEQTPDVLGHSITVNGTSHTVVGVMPAALSHVALRRGLLGDVDLWMPLQPSGDELRDRRDLRVVACLAPGVSPEALGARLDGVAQALEPSLPVE